MLAVAERARLRVGSQPLGKYPCDPRHLHERRVLATPDVVATTDTAWSAMAAVLTPGWDTYFTSVNEGLPNDGLTVIGASECSRRAGQRSRSISSIAESKVRKGRALGRKLFSEFCEQEKGHFAAPAASAENICQMIRENRWKA